MPSSCFSDICFWTFLEAVTGNTGMTQYLPLRRNIEAQKAIGRAGWQMNWARKQCPAQDRRWDRKMAFRLRSWNLQKSGPRLKGAAWRFKFFLMSEGLILKPRTIPLDM